MKKTLDYLKSDRAEIPFGFKGQLGEASKAIEPILTAFEDADNTELPHRISKTFQKQLKTEIDQLKKAGLKRVIRITSPRFISSQNRYNLGFTRWVDASREWRECEIAATVLERYMDMESGECVIERFDEEATLTLRQSRHIKASDQRNAKNSKKDMYIRAQYHCPSCGAELTHIADRTNCPYCGAYITFHFFDWQLDSFHLDMRKSILIDGAKVVATTAGVGAFLIAAKIAALLADAWDRRDAEHPNVLSHNNQLSAALTVIFYVGFLIVLTLLAMPWYARLALGIIAAALIIRCVIKNLKETEQSRKKESIVRYSDAYLRSCVYDELWKDIEIDHLIDFSIDNIILKSVQNTEATTIIEITASMIKKNISPQRRIEIVSEDVNMKLIRARYPERKKSKGKIMEEKECPNCGANFELDENQCCSYCGYGLKIENYVWRRIG